MSVLNMLNRMGGARMGAVLLLAGAMPGLAAAQAAAAKTTPPEGFASVAVLWPEGAPGAVGKDEADVPKLYCYPAGGEGPHTAVVVLPGGGYNHLVMEKEGGTEARWLQAHGVSAYVLEYRLSPRYRYPAQMEDGLRAVRFVRAHAAEWKIRPDAIGVWGFSAGGHMAGYLATAEPYGEPLPASGVADEARKQDAIDKLSAHPDFAILSYARLDLDPAIPGTFGMESITGKGAPQAEVDALSPVLHVTKNSSPSFIYATEMDEKVNSMNATAFFDALHKAGVPPELHVFQQGPHGTHMGTDQPKFPELAVMPLLLEHWMELNGWMGEAGSRE